MAIRDFNATRLFVPDPLAEGNRIEAGPDQMNYLVNVLRLKPGDEVLIFNGRDGEWRARLADVRKRGLVLEALARVRAQEGGPDVHYLFAPLKRARLDYMVQKATEMGVAKLQPVITRRTIAERVNLDRMRANVIEAAEQCGILRVPEIGEPAPLAGTMADWPEPRRLVFCDESAALSDPIRVLGGLAAGAPVAVLIGPEGGFAPEERELLLSKPFTLAISLGPRIMRADTAAVAALALVNAVLGDWRAGGG